MCLLERLRAAAGQFVSLADLGASRSRVWDDLEALGGVRVSDRASSLPRGGLPGTGSPRLCPDQIEHRLGTRRIGRRIAVWNRVGSTNDLAARAASTTANDGLVVLAEEQTAGRGQRGRTWTVPPRSSILMSVLLFPPPDLAPLGPRGRRGLRLAHGAGRGRDGRAGLELDRARRPDQVAQRRPGRRPQGRRHPRRTRTFPSLPRSCRPRSRTRAAPGVVIGIGLNADIDLEAFPPELRHRATSVKILSGGAVDRSVRAGARPDPAARRLVRTRADRRARHPERPLARPERASGQGRPGGHARRSPVRPPRRPGFPGGDGPRADGRRRARRGSVIPGPPPGLRDGCGCRWGPYSPWKCDEGYQPSCDPPVCPSRVLLETGGPTSNLLELGPTRC